MIYVAIPEKYCNWYCKSISASIKYYLKHNHEPSFFYKKKSTMICIVIILIEQTTHKINEIKEIWMRLSPGCVPLNYQILNVQWVKSLKETQVTFLTQRFLKCWTWLFIHEADATPINWVKYTIYGKVYCVYLGSCWYIY